MVFKKIIIMKYLLPFGPPPGRADFKIWGASNLKEHNPPSHQEEDFKSKEERQHLPLAE